MVHELDTTAVTLGWAHDHKPLLQVPSGSRIHVSVPECSNGQIGPDASLDDFIAIDMDQIDPISGPIYVEGAQPGDALEVEIVGIHPGSYGWSANYPGTGLLADDFPDPWLYLWDLSDPVSTEYVQGVSVPIQPVLGMVGCTPSAPGPHPAVPPMRTGGNLDCRHVRQGARVLLPVEVEGALLGVGDPHGAQGDGEVAGSGIEMPADVVIRVSVRRDVSVRTPQVDLPNGIEERRVGEKGYKVTLGVAPSLYEAARSALREMVRWVSDTYGLLPIEAYHLCSVAGDLSISEVVNDPSYVVSMQLPRVLFQNSSR